MKLFAFLSLFLASLIAIPAHAQDRPDYAPGQVWEYRNRPEDAGSLLKIQRVENDPRGEPIYHVSVIGIRIEGMPADKVPHLPVSRQTLDASVTRLSASTAEFPDPAEGIQMWRDANGGVFTIPIAQIIGIIQKAIDDQKDN